MKKAQTGQGEQISRCISCLVCQESYESGMSQGKHAICAVNPRSGFEGEFPLRAKKDGAQRLCSETGDPGSRAEVCLYDDTDFGAQSRAS